MRRSPVRARHLSFRRPLKLEGEVLSFQLGGIAFQPERLARGMALLEALARAKRDAG